MRSTAKQKKRTACRSAARVSAQLLLSFLAAAASPAFGAVNEPANAQIILPVAASPITLVAPIAPLAPEPPAPAEHTFTLRHIFHHGTNRHPGLHRKHGIAHPDSAQVWLAAEDGYPKQRMPTPKASSGPMQIQRLADRRPSVVDPMVAMAREGGFVSVLSPSAWTTDQVAGPNITDKVTVLNLALMAANAYVETPEGADWEDVGSPFNRSVDFGWEDDGLRGHVWADENNSTIVIGLKGTSMAVFDGDGTTTNDKVNDNLFFSCCCAQQGPWTWHQVCDCASGTYKCNNTCVRRALREESRYYQAARELYANVTELYPHSGVWLTGHSLGGAVSSMLGLTYGVPTVTFEAVPEALPAGRLGLPVPPGSDPGTPQTRQDTGIYHFGHTADPVYVGSCNGATASCSFGGYAMESACHTGHECTYDTVSELGWRVGIGTHKIRSVINDVILKYDEVPECRFTPECRDCGSWTMYESNGTETSTTSRSSSTTSTRTRTATCQTPGWWGCLDETTTGTTTTTSTSSTSTTTCHTPGWFGCKDKTTTTTTTTSEMPPPGPTTATTTCETPGRFWGCKDETTPATTTTSTRSRQQTQHLITSAPVMPTASPTVSVSTSTATATDRVPGKEPKCTRRSWWWLGRCKERDETDDEGSAVGSGDL